MKTKELKNVGTFLNFYEGWHLLDGQFYYKIQGWWCIGGCALKRFLRSMSSKNQIPYFHIFLSNLTVLT